MAVGKDRIARRVVLWTAALFLVWLFGVWPPPVWWRTHEPRCTAMMRLRNDCAVRRWADGRIGSRTTQPISPSAHPSAILERMVIIAEDSRFKTHHGIDLIELREAWATGGRRGASTITQQLAKNPYFFPSRPIFRKPKKTGKTVRLRRAF